MGGSGPVRAGFFGRGKGSGLPRGGGSETFLHHPHLRGGKLYLDTWRWHGVPFFLRSGKRLPKRATEVAIQFKEPPNLLFKGNLGDLSPNVLVVRIQPDEGITLKFETKVPGMTMEVRTVNMDFRYNTSFAEGTSEAYETLIAGLHAGGRHPFHPGR